MTARVELVTTTGVFSLDGEAFEVENNVWLVGDDDEVLVVDAAHDAAPIAAQIGSRRVVAIVCTHGHNDHINAVAALADQVGDPPVLLHPADRMLWDAVYPKTAPDGELADGDVLRVADAELAVLHTPGHSPGGVCLHDRHGARVFAGDTLFRGGPGATGRSYSDFAVIIESIRTKLLVLAADTVVAPGHGETTTIGDEAPHLGEWIARGT
jgi:glyoxylase-like metal-dependent hydrolase (beta-lactamase superfamily II)